MGGSLPRATVWLLVFLLLAGGFAAVGGASSLGPALNEVLRIRLDGAVSALYSGRAGALLVVLRNGSVLSIGSGGLVRWSAWLGVNVSSYGLVLHSRIKEFSDRLAVLYGPVLSVFGLNGSLLLREDFGTNYAVTDVVGLSDGFLVLVDFVREVIPTHAYLIHLLMNGSAEEVSYVGESAVSVAVVNASCFAIASLDEGVVLACGRRHSITALRVPGVTYAGVLGDGLAALTVDGRVLAIRGGRFRELAYVGGELLHAARTAGGGLVVGNAEGKIAYLGPEPGSLYCGKVLDWITSLTVDYEGRYVTITGAAGPPQYVDGSLQYPSEVIVYKLNEALPKGAECLGNDASFPAGLAGCALAAAAGGGGRRRLRALLILAFAAALLGSVAYSVMRPGPASVTETWSGTTAPPQTRPAPNPPLRNVSLVIDLRDDEFINYLIRYIGLESYLPHEEWELLLDGLNETLEFPVKAAEEFLESAGLDVEVCELNGCDCVFQVRAPDGSGNAYLMLENCSRTHGVVMSSSVKYFLLRLKTLLQEYQARASSAPACVGQSLFDGLLSVLSGEWGINLSSRYVRAAEYVRAKNPAAIDSLITEVSEGGVKAVKAELVDWYAPGRARTVELTVLIPQALIDLYGRIDPDTYPLITPEDPVIKEVVKALNETVWSDPYSNKEWRLANLLTQIPQQLNYSEGIPSWPILTLAKGAGGCAARTYLGITLLQAAGIPSGEIIMKGRPLHSYLAVAVEIPPWLNATEQFLTTVKLPVGPELTTTTKYYPVEVTPVNNERKPIGEWVIYPSTEDFVRIHSSTRLAWEEVLGIFSSQ